MDAKPLDIEPDADGSMVGSARARVAVPAKRKSRVKPPAARSTGTRKRRRIRSPHPGLVLIKPDPAGRHP